MIGGIIAGLWTSACMVFVWWLCGREIKALAEEKDRAWEHMRDWQRFAKECYDREESAVVRVAELDAENARLRLERGDLLLQASSLRECRNKWQAAHDSTLLQWREAESGMQQQLGERDARARLAANAIGQQHGADWARGIASRALSPKHYWRLEAAIEREVARAEDRVDNVDVAAVLKRHRREALRGGEG